MLGVVISYLPHLCLSPLPITILDQSYNIGTYRCPHIKFKNLKIEVASDSVVVGSIQLIM